MKGIRLTRRRAILVGTLCCVVLSALALAASLLYAPLAPAPVVASRPPDAAPIALEGASAGVLHVRRIGHASVLLDFNGYTVLTDPWFSEKMHYHHGEPLGLALEELPRLDVVIASHAHYDHFDIETFSRYPHKDVPFFVGPGMEEAARAAGFTRVRQLAPWESATVGPLTITAAPGSHKVAEITYVLQAHDFTVYFGGDTRLIPELRELSKRFPSIQLALLPVNGLHVVGEQVVMNAEEAAELAGLLKAEVAVPIHYRFHGSWFTDTFILRYDGDSERFKAAAQKVAPETRVRILPPGQRLTIKRAPGPQAS